MKKITLILFILLSAIGYAQNGINYKALIKDVSGNIIPNTTIQIQFTIAQDVTNVYTETHSPTTDANGIIIVNIGEGTATSGDFNTINWATTNHSLNVQVDTGSGLVDLGTTQFMSVPYAKHSKTAKIAANVKGLEAIDEGNGKGWRLIGRDANNYGDIGENATDLSTSTIASTTRGATGDYSIAMGNSTTASGIGSTAMGTGTVASGTSSIAMGSFTTASGTSSTAMGFYINADANKLTAIGRYNIGGGNPTNWIDNDPLFEIGNGNSTTRSNAVTVLKNGNVGIGTATPQELLHISGGRLRIGSETIEDTGSNQLSVDASLIPTTNNAFRLGNASNRWIGVWATDGTINTSDRREKENIKSLNYGLSEVLQMKPVSFKWKKRINQDTKLGLIAQDLLEVIPEVVKTNVWEKDENTGKLIKKELDRLGVYYSDLIPVLIKAIQEQQKIIDNEKSVNAKQNLQLEALLSRIEILEINNSK